MNYIILILYFVPTQNSKLLSYTFKRIINKIIYIYYIQYEHDDNGGEDKNDNCRIFKYRYYDVAIPPNGI